MATDVIREFLVRIGYQQTGQKEFLSGLKGVTAEAIELGVAIKGAAVAVQSAVSVIAGHLEQLYFLSQRTGATAESIKAIGFAATQTGSSVEAARGSIENFGRFLRTIPNARAVLSNIGVDTVGKTTDQMLNETLKRLNAMQPAVAMAWANVLGIDEKTLLGAGDKEFAAAQTRYDDMRKAAHYNVKAAAEDSHFFMVALRDVGAAIGILQEKVASAFTRSMGEEITRFRVWLVANFDKISAGIEWLGRKVLEAGTIVTEMVHGVWTGVRSLGDAWKTLDQDSQIVILALAAVAAAMWLVSRHPIGALLTALAFLWTDYRQWKDEGKESAIPWAKWEPVFLKAKDAALEVWEAIKHLYTTLSTVLEPWFAEHKNSFSDLFNAGAVKKNIEEIGHAISWIPKTLEGYVKLYGGLATGNWKLALEGLQQIKDQVFGDGAPPFMQPFGEQVDAQQRGNGPLGQAWRWVKGKLGLGGSEGTTETFDQNMNPMARGLLDTIAGHEAAGYNTLYGGGSFADYSKHPNQAIPITSGPNKGKTSSAAGRYQFLKDTWDEAQKALNLPDFSPQSQDKAAWWLAQRDYKKNTNGRDLSADLNSGDPNVIAGIGEALRGTWTSLPGGIEATTNTPRFLQELKANVTRERNRGVNIDPGYNPNPVTGTSLEQQRSLPPGTLNSLQPTLPLGVGPQSSYSNDNSRQVAWNQTNNITVNASDGDGNAIGRAVQEHQRSLAQQTVRDLTSRLG